MSELTGRLGLCTMRGKDSTAGSRILLRRGHIEGLASAHNAEERFC